jgi:glycine/D-amino acid oxidase-like deaminating enzyme
MPHEIAVLGAGVIGLAAGIRLLEEIQDIKVTIYADLTGNETTSRGSGGLWQPYSLGVSLSAAATKHSNNS